MTTGTINLKVKLNNDEVVHPFQVVYDKFPLRSNGVLGRDFMAKYKASINYDKAIMQVGNTKWKLVLY